MLFRSLTAKNLLKRDVRSSWKPEAKRLNEILQTMTSADGSAALKDGQMTGRIVATVQSARPMPSSSHEQLLSITGRFMAEAYAGAQPQLADPLMKLLWQRLKTHVFLRLAASSSTERVRVASTASESLAAIGLGEFITQISSIAEIGRAHV